MTTTPNTPTEYTRPDLREWTIPARPTGTTTSSPTTS
jgi:hypothetical protein